jgi:hypothetical protein
MVGLNIDEHFHELQQLPPPYFETLHPQGSNFHRSLDLAFHQCQALLQDISLAIRQCQDLLQVISLAIQMDRMKTFTKKLMQFFHPFPHIFTTKVTPCTFSPKT